MGVTFAALHRAQELVENPMGEVERRRRIA
jgi:hypothetical protein